MTSKLEEKSLEPRVFHLDRVGSQWEEFLERDTRQKVDKKFTDEFKALLKEVSGNAGEFKLRGVKVAILRPGKLNLSLLAQELPHMVDKYTRQVIKTEFDQAAFALEEPELFEQYRAQGLVLVGTGI